MIFQDEFIAAEDQIRSVLDYEIKIRKLSEKYQKYCALTGEMRSLIYLRVPSSSRLYARVVLREA